MSRTVFRSILTTLLLLPLYALAAEPLSEQRKEEIGQIVQQDCGSCHGLTLKGGLGPNLDPARLAQYPDGFLKVTILHGRPGTPMPPWGPLFSGDEIHYIATQLRSGAWYVP
ncbi:MAG: cytochrome c [Gammaproteobacteria bacterium]|jgi:cytochrome c55X|nr:cytochrome c [Gammaproteobacteria bacterium]